MGCNAVVKVICWLRYVCFQTNILKPPIQKQHHHTLKISPDWCEYIHQPLLQYGHHLLRTYSILYLQRCYSLRTDYRLTIYYIIQYLWMKGKYLAGYCHQWAGDDLSDDSVTSVDAFEYPSTSYSYSSNDQRMEYVPRAPSPDDAPDEETIVPQKPGPICTPVWTKVNLHWKVIWRDNVGGKVYGKMTRLHNKHYQYSDPWNPWHPFFSAYDFQQAPSLSQQTNL